MALTVNSVSCLRHQSEYFFLLKALFEELIAMKIEVRSQPRCSEYR